MGTLRPPSLQHLSRIWHPDSDVIARRLVGMVDHAPSFSYRQAHDAIRDMLIARVSHESVSSGLSRIPRAALRQDFVQIAKLVHRHFRTVPIDYTIDFAPKYAHLDYGLRVSFNPPIVYSSAGELVIPWFSLWRTFSLAGDRLSLFVTLARECLSSDPALLNAKFIILDFSAAGSDKSRELKILDSSSLPQLMSAKKESMLRVFRAGYAQARKMIENRVRMPQKGISYEGQYPLVLGWDEVVQARSSKSSDFRLSDGSN